MIRLKYCFIIKSYFSISIYCIIEFTKSNNFWDVINDVAFDAYDNIMSRYSINPSEVMLCATISKQMHKDLYIHKEQFKWERILNSQILKSAKFYLIVSVLAAYFKNFFKKFTADIFTYSILILSNTFEVTC
jgi:hypothetical protein